MTNDLRGFDRFLIAVMEIAATRMLHIYEENKGAFLKSVGDDLEGLGFTPLGLRETPQQAALNRITSGLIEVRSALENLEAIPVYARRNPYRSTGISDVQYLRYHIENYYQEVHLLRERLLSLVRVLNKVYKSSAVAKRLSRFAKPVEKAVVQIFAPFAAPRALHVHEKRLEDEHLRRLSAIEILVPMHPIFADLLRSAVRGARKDKIVWLESQTEIIRRRVDEYFDVIAEILIDRNGKFITPAG